MTYYKLLLGSKICTTPLFKMISTGFNRKMHLKSKDKTGNPSQFKVSKAFKEVTVMSEEHFLKKRNFQSDY